MVNIKELPIRREVLEKEKGCDPAVNLAYVVDKAAPAFMLDPDAFFERTYLTDSMKELVVKVAMALLGMRSANVGGRDYVVDNKLVLLLSDIGGGKTHSLTLLYHIFANVLANAGSADEVFNRLKVLDKDVAEFFAKHFDELKHVKVVVSVGSSERLAPSPVKPLAVGSYTIKTLWGYIAQMTGRYEAMRRSDEAVVAPTLEELRAVLDGSGAVVLIDEIGRYYETSGLEPQKISAFLMNLAEVLVRYDIKNVAVVIALPYEITEERGVAETRETIGMIHRPDLVRVVSDVLQRVNPVLIKPVREKVDLVEILKKRIFDLDQAKLTEYARRFIADHAQKAYPEYVKGVMLKYELWKEVERTYPFHPAFVELLNTVVANLRHLQKTRDALKIAMLTVRAVRSGVYDAVDGDEVGSELIMPYHIPIIASELLDDILFRTFASEYVAFRYVLETTVVTPRGRDELKPSKWEDFAKTLSRHLSGLKEQVGRDAFKLLTIIWIRSMLGLGYPTNLHLYPTKEELVYYLTPIDRDVRDVLDTLKVVIPQLLVAGNPELDSSRWFLASIPSLDELIEQTKANVTTGEALNRLKEGLDRKIVGDRSQLFDNVKVVSAVSELQMDKEVLSNSNPVLVVFACPVPKDELAQLLRGRNNLVVLAPYVEGFDEPEKLTPEDIKAIPELGKLHPNSSVWDALLEIVKYLFTVESLEDKDIASLLFMHKGVQAGAEWGKLLEDLGQFLKGKVKDKVNYYERVFHTLLSKTYTRVYKGAVGGGVKRVDGLVLETRKGHVWAEQVEDFLRMQGIAPASFTKDDLLNIIRDYMGLNPQEVPIHVGSVWQFIKTTDKTDVPLIRLEQFIANVKELVISLDYAVKVGDVIIWKPIFKNRVEAETSDEGEKAVAEAEKLLKGMGRTWFEAELTYWELIYDIWLQRVKASTPPNVRLAILRSGEIYSIDDVKVKEVVKLGKLFLEKKRYTAVVALNLPEKLRVGTTYTVSGQIKVEGYGGQVDVRLEPSPHVRVEPSEFSGTPPITISFSLTVSEPVLSTLKVTIHGGEGEVIDTKTYSLTPETEWVIEVVQHPEKTPQPSDILVELKTENILLASELLRRVGGVANASAEVATEQMRVGVNAYNVANAGILDQILSFVRSVSNVAKATVKSEVSVSFSKEVEWGAVSELVGNNRAAVTVKRRVVSS